jgi:hypothetical protein
MTPRNAFSPSLRRSLPSYLAKTVHPKTRNLGASGAFDMMTVIGTRPEITIARLNVRLRRYTIVMIAYDHTEFGTDMMCIIGDVLSLNVRQGRSALPSMWWAYGAEYCTPTPNRPVDHTLDGPQQPPKPSPSRVLEHVRRNRTKSGTVRAHGGFTA